jgi:hypothetical protein
VEFVRRVLRGLFHKKSIISCGIALCSAIGCDTSNTFGYLKVNFIEPGFYEVYKIASEQPLQFVSEQAGTFNEPLSLRPGSYLVLADCSSQIVNIYPGKSEEITAHKINFLPMLPPRPMDRFSIQCARSERTRSRQNFSNKYSLAVLPGRRDFLVGMIPLQIDIDQAGLQESRVIAHRLSSITVLRPSALKEQEGFDYFLTPASELAPYTESQRDGGRLYVLKGQYNIQLNGTVSSVDLLDGEAREVIPASLRVEAPSNVDLDLAAKVKGTPLFVEVNGEHLLNLNTTYAILPGIVKVRLSTTIQSAEVVAKESETIKLKAKSVLVSLGCEKDEWSCLGSRKITLFERGKSFPFAQSVSDVPILYFGEGVSLGVEGSRNIKYLLGPGDDHQLKVGYVEVVPTPKHKPGVLTDLVRVEAPGGQFSGVSLDLSLDKPTILPLISGLFQIAQYSYFTNDGTRKKASQSVFSTYKRRAKVEITTYLSEKRMLAIDPPKDLSKTKP